MRSYKYYRQREWRRQRRDYFRSLGLTHDGKPRQRGPWHRYSDLDGLPPRKRAVARGRRWRERERYALGLTQRGTKRGAVKLPAKEAAWRELRATMNISMPEFLTGLEREAA
jgi:hypothetical protein